MGTGKYSSALEKGSYAIMGRFRGWFQWVAERAAAIGAPIPILELPLGPCQLMPWRNMDPELSGVLLPQKKLENQILK